MEGFEQTLGAGTLLSIAAGAIALLLVLIIRFNIHAFIALVLVSLLTALVAGIPTAAIVQTLTAAFGSTLGGVALLVALGAMLGRLLEISGGAESLANALVAKFGEKRAPLALGIASLIFGFPIFFDAGLVVMLPVVFTIARRLGGGLLLYGMPVAAAFSVMHVFVPPHPGPVAASELLGADVGMLIVVGLLVAVPIWIVAGQIFGQWIGRRIVLPVPDILSGGPREDSADPAPKPSTVILLLLLPLLAFLAIAVFLYRGLFLDPSELPSALIGKPFPAFSLPSLDDPERTLSEADIKGKPALVNVWATWCPACRHEHPVLNKLSEAGVVIHGVNYKDQREPAQKWLRDLHNPYQLNIEDAKGSLGLDLGVYGAPETFFVDAKGIIRHKFVGTIDERVWRETLAPIYQQLVDEAQP